MGNIGVVYESLGRFAEALEHDRRPEGHILLGLGAACEGLGEYEGALRHLEPALTISREVGDQLLEAEALNSLGETLRAMGNPRRARRHDAALDLARQTGARRRRQGRSTG